MASNYTNDIAKHLLNGIDLETIGVKVEKSSGFLDFPARKEFIEMNWTDRHGLSADLAEFKVSARPLKLNLHVFGTNLMNLRYNLQQLYNELMKPGHQYLKMGGVNFINLVYLKDGITIDRKSKNNSRISYATAELSLVEPYPLNIQFMSDQSTLRQVSLQIYCSRPITINWGDKTYSYLSQSGTLTHNYSSTGLYAIVIHGEVDSITSVTPTNAVEITPYEYAESWNVNTILTDDMIMKDDTIIF